jgi:hypothetical protein
MDCGDCAKTGSFLLPNACLAGASCAKACGTKSGATIVARQLARTSRDQNFELDLFAMGNFP